MSKTLPTTLRFSSTTSAPIFGVFSVFTITLLEGVTFDTLPNLCKRNSPLEKHVRDRGSLFKRFWVVYKRKVPVYYSAVVLSSKWVTLSILDESAIKWSGIGRSLESGLLGDV